MVQIIRIIVTTIVAGGLSLFLGKVVLEGIKTGKIRHTDSSQVCHKKKNPIGFWSIVLLFSVFISMLTGTWVWVMVDAAKNFK